MNSVHKSAVFIKPNLKEKDMKKISVLNILTVLLLTVLAIITAGCGPI
jgi:hypothetical protein